MNPLCKTTALLSALLLTACTSTEEKVNDLLQRHLDAFVFVEGGSFMMGNPGLGWALGADSYPAHKVTLDSFSIQKFEVTQGDMDLFMEVTGYASAYKGYSLKREKHPKRFNDSFPAVSTWHDARAFCQWLGQLSTKSIDLPTEAQWEYAARSRGQMYRFATDTGEATAEVNIAPAPRLGVLDPHALPAPPGSYPPNPLGLYDMAGNAVEWVYDNYQPDYYQHSPELNPEGPPKGHVHDIFEQKVARGGSFYDYWGNTTVSKLNIPSGIAGLDTGFRCAME